jgi:hypothetical protein
VGGGGGGLLFAAWWGSWGGEGGLLQVMPCSRSWHAEGQELLLNYHMTPAVTPYHLPTPTHMMTHATHPPTYLPTHPPHPPTHSPTPPTHPFRWMPANLMRCVPEHLCRLPGLEWL